MKTQNLERDLAATRYALLRMVALIVRTRAPQMLFEREFERCALWLSRQPWTWPMYAQVTKAGAEEREILRRAAIPAEWEEVDPAGAVVTTLMEADNY
jgi:hypothetical protein